MSNNERKEEMDREIVLEVAKIFSFVKVESIYRNFATIEQFSRRAWYIDGGINDDFVVVHSVDSWDWPRIRSYNEDEDYEYSRKFDEAFYQLIDELEVNKNFVDKYMLDEITF